MRFQAGFLASLAPKFRLRTDYIDEDVNSINIGTAGGIAGDFAVIAHHARGSAGLSSLPSGWTLLAQGSGTIGGVSTVVRIIFKELNGGESNVTLFTAGNSRIINALFFSKPVGGTLTGHDGENGGTTGAISDVTISQAATDAYPVLAIALVGTDGGVLTMPFQADGVDIEDDFLHNPSSGSKNLVKFKSYGRNAKDIIWSRPDSGTYQTYASGYIKLTL